MGPLGFLAKRCEEEGAMSDIEQAKAAQLRNIENKIGLGLDAVRGEIVASGRVKHGDVRSWLMERYQLGYGDANALAHASKEADSVSTENTDPLASIYSGKKEHLRAIHEALIEKVSLWGAFEAAPKKAYVALRRKKQFAMLGPKNASVAELGINLKSEVQNDRLVAQKPGGMCQYTVELVGPRDIDEELLEVLRLAFEAAG
jgi:hypothetical protein